jgi:hypothetical protein
MLNISFSPVLRKAATIRISKSKSIPLVFDLPSLLFVCTFYKTSKKTPPIITIIAPPRIPIVWKIPPGLAIVGVAVAGALVAEGIRVAVGVLVGVRVGVSVEVIAIVGVRVG